MPRARSRADVHIEKKPFDAPRFRGHCMRYLPFLLDGASEVVLRMREKCGAQRIGYAQMERAGDTA